MSSGKVDVGKGVELYYEDYGSGDPILIIPGLTCTTEFFEKNLQVLAGENRVICYDPRSQGRSSISEHGNNFVQRAHDLATLIEALELDKLIIAGSGCECTFIALRLARAVQSALSPSI